MKNLTLLATLIAAFALAAAPRAMADTGGPDDFGYTYADTEESTVTYEWVDISGMTPTSLTMGDDDESSAIALAFPFTFYGVPYNTIYIHANGFVKFDAEVYDYYMGDQCPLPVSDSVNGIIAFYLRDFNPGETAGGTIRYATDTTSDPDRFIVEFAGVPKCCSPYPTGEGPDPVSAQLVLYANSEIQVNVLDPGPQEGGDATIGVEAPGAIAGLSYRGCLISTSVAASTAVRFYPPTSGTPVVPLLRKLWGRPGDPLTYDFTIFNLGTAAVTFTITETTSAWSPVLSATSLPLAAGGSSPFTVTVTIPAAAADGAHDVSTVTFTPDTGDPVTVNAIAVVQDESTDTFWQELPEVPMQLETPSAAADGNYIFVLGGLRLDEISGDPIYEDAVHRYDVTTNAWVSSEDGGIEPMPQGRSSAAACAMDGKVYVIGGYGQTGGEAQIAWDLYIYDIATNAWDSGALMPSGRVEHAAVCDAANGEIYVMGGIINATDTTLENAELTLDMIVYNAAGDSWTAGTPLTYYRYDFVAGMPDDNTIIVAGNAYDMPGGRIAESYSLTSTTWTPIDELSVGRTTAAGGVMEGGKFCLAGGFNLVAANGREDTYECYVGTYWIPQIALLNVARNAMAYATHNGQIYAIAGDTVDESVDPPVLALSGAFERYPHSAIPDAPPDTAEDAEDVPPDVTPDGDAVEDAPTDVRPDTTTDVRPDTTDTTGDVEEEGEEKDEGCGCQMVM
jgi:hypothetical protein